MCSSAIVVFPFVVVNWRDNECETHGGRTLLPVRRGRDLHHYFLRDPEGYWPANVVLGHDRHCDDQGCVSHCAAALVDQLRPGHQRLSRIFHASKASRTEREAGLEHLPQIVRPVFASGKANARPRANIHGTVKPIELMRWLVRLVAPPGGLVLDPFAGSGSTGCAVLLEGNGRQFVGLEREADYARIARARLAHWAKTQPSEAARKVAR